jgi:hypothetical protein
MSQTISSDSQAVVIVELKRENATSQRYPSGSLKRGVAQVANVTLRVR